jgi:hypothetical protein
MSSVTWRELSRISTAGMRPPSGRLTRRWEMMHLSVAARSRDSRVRPSVGKKLKIRLSA